MMTPTTASPRAVRGIRWTAAAKEETAAGGVDCPAPTSTVIVFYEIWRRTEQRAPRMLANSNNGIECGNWSGSGGERGRGSGSSSSFTGGGSVPPSSPLAPKERENQISFPLLRSLLVNICQSALASWGAPTTTTRSRSRSRPWPGCGDRFDAATPAGHDDQDTTGGWFKHKLIDWFVGDIPCAAGAAANHDLSQASSTVRACGRALHEGVREAECLQNQ